MNKVRVPHVYAGGIPLLTDIHNPMLDALTACVDLDDKQSEMSSKLVNMWNSETSANLSLRALLAEGEKIAFQSLLMPSDDVSSYFFTGDTFDGSGVLDPSTTAYLDKEGGFMILPIISSELLNDYIGTINILEESVGRPGDVTAIRSLTFDTDNNPVVGISSDTHDRAEELIDNRPDTYYVWEHVLASRVQPVRRAGASNAIISDPNGSQQDIKALMGEHGLKWKGNIPGRGEVEKDLYTFTNGDKLDDGTISPILNAPKKAKLVIEFAFVDPVPLSSIRITPLIEEGLANPKVSSISASMVDGRTSNPPGLPRSISTTSGREVSIERATKAGIGRADYSGSGVFFVRTNSSGVRSVRIELESPATPARLGVAHPFYVKNTETKEQAHILGFRIKNKTSRGQERIAEPNSSNLESVSSRTGDRNLVGPLSNIVAKAISYQKEKAAKRQASNPSTTQSSTPPTWLTKIMNEGTYGLNIKTGKGSVADTEATRIITNIGTAAGVGNVAQALRTSKNTSNLIGEAIGGKIAEGCSDTAIETVRILSEVGSTDIITAQRAAVVLKDIAFDARIFSEQGEILSETMTLPGQARALNLFVKVDIPQDWPEGPWITTQIKTIIDGQEQNWIDIKANGTPWSKDPAPETIVLPSPSNKIKVRIRLQRPSGDSYQYETPIVSSYAVKGLPK